MPLYQFKKIEYLLWWLRGKKTSYEMKRAHLLSGDVGTQMKLEIFVTVFSFIQRTGRGESGNVKVTQWSVDSIPYDRQRSDHGWLNNGSSRVLYTIHTNVTINQLMMKAMDNRDEASIPHHIYVLFRGLIQ